MKRRAVLHIGPNEAGTSVLDLLSGRFTYHRPEQWEALIAGAQIHLNRRPAGPRESLKLGDRLEYVGADLPEPSVDRDYSILFEDHHLLVVDKPANLPCHPAGRYFNHTLWALLKAGGHYPCLAPVHRLDRETSGIVVLAKTPVALKACQQQFREHQPHKLYLALVEGRFPRRSVTAAGFLAPDPGSAIRKKRRFYPMLSVTTPPVGACSCTTFLRRLTVCGDLSLVAVRPQTGRTHQIRATLLRLGYLLVGDKIYGLDETLFLRFIDDRLSAADRLCLRLPRQALHAARLGLKHPCTGQPLVFKAPLPADMRRLAGHSRI